MLGSGRPGANARQLFARAAREVLFSYSRAPDKLEALAVPVADGRAGAPAEAAQFGETLVLPVPWVAVDNALRAAGPLPCGRARAVAEVSSGRRPASAGARDGVAR